MPSLRRINSHAAWCSNYEFEDVVSSIDDVELLELEPGRWFPHRQRLARSLAWRGRGPAFSQVNPGLKPFVVNRDYEIFMFVAMNVWDLLYLNAIRDWQSRCRVKICYITEFYAGLASQCDQFLHTLSRFDHIFLAFSGSVPAVAGAVGKACHHVPLAADVRRFTPYPKPPRRVIDVLSIGGRVSRVHDALVTRATAGDLFYMYDTIPSALVRPTSGKEHRDLLAACAKRSQFFVAYEAKVGNNENQGQSEVGARYFEGAAAGAVLLGRAPTAPAFRQHFPWHNPVVEVSAEGRELDEALDRLATRRGELEHLGTRNAVHALRTHDWGHRWRSVLQIAGVVPRPALDQRLQSLEALATLRDVQSMNSPAHTSVVGR
jgi:spore maturation protein CgeB